MMAARHLVGGFVLESGIALPEAPVASGEPAIDATFECVDGVPIADPDWRWYHRWTLPDGRPWVSFARRQGEFLIAFEGVHFVLSSHPLRIRASRDPALPLVTVRHLLLDQVVPLVRSVRGELALHAGAVQTRAGAIGFVGESGTGKSTLVASFAAEGARIVSDDCLLLHGARGAWQVSRSYPGVRLWPETARAIMHPPADRALPVAHYNSKVRIIPREPRAALDATALRRLYVLDPRSATGVAAPIAVEPLRGRNGFLPLLKHTYRLDFEDRASLERDLARLAQLVESRMVKRLTFPFDLSRLGALRRAVENDLTHDR